MHPIDHESEPGDLRSAPRGGVEPSRRRGSWYTYLAPLVVLLFTGGLALVLADRNHSIDVQRFDTLKEKMLGEINRRVKVYEYGLRGTRGLYAASRSVERNEFRSFVESRDLLQEFPAATGIGWIRHLKTGDIQAFLDHTRADDDPGFKIKTLSNQEGDDRFVIEFIEPVAVNQAAVGLDIGSEGNRRRAAEHAMLTGEVAITERITLVQATGEGAGFLILLPVYFKGADPQTPEQREAQIQGWVYMTILAERMFEGTSDIADGELELEVFDGDILHDDHLLYTYHRFPKGMSTPLIDRTNPDSVFEDTWPVQIGGRTWTLAINTTPVFKASSRAGIWVTCLGGFVLSSLLYMLLKMQDTSLLRARSIAQSMTVEFRKLALTDRLTGLPNRELFTDRLNRAIRRAQNHPDYRFAILFFDFDRFKAVNDGLGHDVGDALLMGIAERFKQGLRPADTAARLGGDEFVVLLNNISDDWDARQSAERLVKMFAEPYQLMGHTVVSTASAGLVSNSADYENAEDMLRDADAAMYQAKETGKARVVTFDQAMREVSAARLGLESDLRDAITQEQLRLVYQPIIGLNGAELLGFEALVRWAHPTRGLITPAEFIPIAEDSGLIVPIGQWVLEEACRQLVRWNDRGASDGPLSMSVNLSLRQLCHHGIIEMIQKTVSDTGIDPALLTLEITESTIIDERNNMIPLLERIKELGISLAMDDFGTGQSSMSCLHKLPVDILKIDRGFIESMSDNHELAAIMQSIISVAQHLGMTTVAEGIETSEQLAMLQALDCDQGQGYHISKPMPPEAAEQYLEQTRRAA